MLADLFAPANLLTTLLCIAALILAGVVQYRLYLSSVSVWVRRLPMLVCGGAAVLLLVLSVILFFWNAWYGLACFLVTMVALLMLIACAIGHLAARGKQKQEAPQV